MKNDNGTLACLGWITLLVVVVVFGSIVNGWVLSMLWEWFVVPLFNAPSLSIAYAIGLTIVVALLTHQSVSNNNSESDTSTTIIRAIAVAFVSPLVTLVFGYIVHLFV